jgi:hypothetical protein
VLLVTSTTAALALQERRLKRLEGSLARLRAACQELGEDEKFAAAGVGSWQQRCTGAGAPCACACL